MNESQATAKYEKRGRSVELSTSVEMEGSEVRYEHSEPPQTGESELSRFTQIVNLISYFAPIVSPTILTVAVAIESNINAIIIIISLSWFIASFAAILLSVCKSKNSQQNDETPGNNNSSEDGNSGKSKSASMQCRKTSLGKKK